MSIVAWFRRRPVAGGRHTRAVPAVSVPGAAAGVVAAACDRALAPSPHRSDWCAPQGPAVPLDPPVGYEAPQPEPLHTGVALGFADGAELALADDDPRTASFRSAADALLAAQGR